MESVREIDVDRNLLLKHPGTFMVAGSTGSGKTRLVREILHHFDKISNLNRPIRVIWCYGMYQELYRVPIDGAVANVTYVKGFPETTDSCDVLVLDDLQSTAGDDKRLADLFTRYSHHRNVSVFFVVQNLFLQSKHMRTVSLNSHYLILLSSRRDRGQVSRLATQLFPGETKYFLSAYKSALSRDYGYIVIDLTPTTREEYRLKTNIIPTQYPIVIFQKEDAL